jgi:DNA-binding MarR family transcriptional regulator
MPTWQPDLAPLVARIPRLYHLLRALGDQTQADLGVTSAMRSVMHSLAAGEPRSVPDLARQRPVSRQHMQTLVNDLLAARLVETLPNAAHRRSPLIALTDDGRRQLKLLQTRETDLLARTAPAVSHAELAAATRLIDLLERDLQRRLMELQREATA